MKYIRNDEINSGYYQSFTMSETPENQNIDESPIIDQTPLCQKPTSYFETKTYFDASFDDVRKKYPRLKIENISPVFAIITGYEFFKNHLLSKNKHEENIYRSMMFIGTMCNVGKFTERVTFEQVLTLTNLNKSSICYTTTNIVSREDPELKYMIPDLKKDFCIIFHKKGQYAIVIGDSKTDMYYVRDCIEQFQFDFKDKAKLITHIKDMYIMSSGIAVRDDNTIDVEYIVIDNGFEHSINIIEEAPCVNENHHVIDENNPLNIRYVRTKDLPDDGVDIMESQRKFGDWNDRNIMNNYQYDGQYHGIDYGPKWTVPKHNYYDSAEEEEGESDNYAKYVSSDEDNYVRATYVSDGEEYFIDSP